MTRNTVFILIGLLCSSASAQSAITMGESNAPKPPVADVRPFQVSSPYGRRADPYYWLRDDTRTDKDVLAYLAAENAYADAMLADTKPLQAKLYEEMAGRIKQDDASVPYQKKGHWYYTRHETGKQYPIHARRRAAMDAPEQVMLDVNQMAAGHGYFQVDDWAVSPDARLLAWAEDSLGRYQYTIRVKNLETGEIFPDTITNAEPNIAWAADNRTLLYVSKDPVTLLGDKVRKHTLGADVAKDPLVYEQTDKSFYTSVGTTKDEEYVLIHSQSTVSTETRVAKANDPELAFTVLIPRERDHEYEAQHLEGRWILRTNWQAKNFRIVEADADKVRDRGQWRDLIAHRSDAFVDGFDVFRDFLAVDEHSNGLANVRIRPWASDKTFVIASDEPAYATSLGTNPGIDTKLVRYTYTSLTTPDSTFDFDTLSGAKTLLKREPVLGGFDQGNYRTEHLWATARDGTKVPVSLVYRKGLRRDGTAPLLQYAYGSYGSSIEPAFDYTIISLLDRGFIYAIAHIRGGQEMGRDWYEKGRLLNKRNTFTDFIDVTRYLVAQKYVDPKRVFGWGGSAGGLLIGAVANMAPGDYRGLIASVPFVDVVTTMLDESIPLTSNEFDEWGNPENKQYHDYMLAYSPYDNVARQDYPAIFVDTALWDSQVQYYEPAKWVAKLRALKTDSNPLIFRVNMQASHSGRSGRFEKIRETAEQYAFLLQQAGIRE